MRRIILLVIGIAALITMLPASANGQQAGSRRSAVPEASRYLDYFVSHYRTAGSAASPGELDGVGGRLMWSLAPLAGGQDSWLRRTLLGGYLTHSPSEDESVDMLRLGAQADLLLFRAPVAERVFPFVSLGMGAVRVEQAGWRHGPPMTLRIAPPTERRDVHLSLAPGVGARIQLLPGVALRGDARQVIDFRDGIRNNLEISGGISVSG